MGTPRTPKGFGTTQFIAAASLAAMLFTNSTLAQTTPATEAQKDLAEFGDAAVRPVDRRFTFVEETLHGAPPGHVEYEQWVTWKSRSRADHDFNKVSFKHEIEYGLAENIHVALEVADWSWIENSMTSGTSYDASGGELKIRFLDPRTDPLGLGWKTEVGIGRERLEWENRLIVDKVVDQWEFAYNLILGADWGGEKYFNYDENGGEVVQSFGVSYELNPNWYLGAEVLHEIPMPDWDPVSEHNLFVGPNVAYHGKGWAVAATALFQAVGADDEPQLFARCIFEIDF